MDILKNLRLSPTTPSAFLKIEFWLEVRDPGLELGADKDKGSSSGPWAQLARERMQAGRANCLTQERIDHTRSAYGSAASRKDTSSPPLAAVMRRLRVSLRPVDGLDTAPASRLLVYQPRHAVVDVGDHT